MGLLQEDFLANSPTEDAGEADLTLPAGLETRQKGWPESYSSWRSPSSGDV